VASQRGATSVEVLDVDETVAAAVQEIVASGARARLTAKKAAWTGIGARETTGVAAALRGALAGEFDEAAFRQRVEALVEVA